MVILIPLPLKSDNIDPIASFLSYQKTTVEIKKKCSCLFKASFHGCRLECSDVNEIRDNLIY